jgi:glutathione S-transferase
MAKRVKPVGYDESQIQRVRQKQAVPKLALTKGRALQERRMITVHHLNDSRSQRILWLLEELGCEYTIERYQRDPETMLAPAELRKVHPLGKSPVIVDGELTLTESGAIVEYLADRYDTGNHLIPAHGTRARLRCNYWLHYAEGSAMPPLLLKLVFGKVRTAPAPFFVRPVVKGIADKVNATFIDPQLKLHLDYMEGELGKSEWFGGDTFTVADIQMSFPLEGAAARAGLDAGRPKLWRFLERIHARDAYQRALERGGDYTYAPARQAASESDGR